MLEGGVTGAAAAAAAAAARAAEAARRAAEEAARRAAEAARQRAEAARAAAQAQQAQQAAQAKDALKASGTGTLNKGVEDAKKMGDLKFEGDTPTSAPTEDKAGELPFTGSSVDDLEIGGGRTRASGGSSDGSIGGGVTEFAEQVAQSATEIVVEEEASTTDMSDAEMARQERTENLMETPRGEQQLIRDHVKRTERLTAALEAMPPEQRQQFNEIREQVRKTEGQTDVQSADFELEQMAMRGDLTPELTGELHRLATQPMSPILTDKDPQAQNRILAETIRQVADPTSVKQDPKYESCGLNALEQEMVRENPAGYVKFMADMVSRDVRAHLPGDPNINDPTPYSGVPINTNQIDLPLSSDRSLTSTLFQQGLRAAYAVEGELAEDPISPEQFNQIMNEMSPGQDRELVGVSPDQSGAAMDSVTPPAIAVLATVDGSGQANSHAVTITERGKDPETNEPTVTFNDPYGQSITVPEAQFQQELRGLVVPKNSDVGGGSAGDVGGGRVRFVGASSDGILLGGGRSRFSSGGDGGL